MQFSDLLIYSSYLNVNSYEIIDLPEVNKLQERYLQDFSLKNKILISNCMECKKIDRDVFLVSNYAFTELSRDIQNMYFDNILCRAKYGYMICNNISNKDEILKEYSLEELQRKIPGSMILNGNPYRHVILVWGFDKLPDRFKKDKL